MNRNDRVEKIKQAFREAPVSRKLLMLLALALICLGVYVLCAFLVGSVFANIYDDGLGPFYYGMEGNGKPISLILFGVFAVFIFIVFFSGSIRNEAVEIDENGVIYLKSKTKDSAMWMNQKDIPNVFFVGNVNDTVATIYGQLTDKGEKVVAWKKKEKGGEGTQNDLIMATMGSGKTFTYVKNELIQTVLRGDSFIASDPKYELFTDLAMFCKNRGYDVHVLNMDKPEYSEFWNCLKETIDPKTERLDGTRLNDFVTIYMQNSAGGAEDYWYDHH